MDPIQLGKFIASLRNEKNLTQEELAEKLFIDKRKISRWECGTSIPEFDMLIKLSEILDVSLYELSICQRIENDSLTRRIINNFKGIKDFKKFRTIKKIKIVIFILLLISLFITTTFTIKHNNTVVIYQIFSADDKYYIEGNLISAKDFNFIFVKQINSLEDTRDKNTTAFNNCHYSIYDENKRLFVITEDGNYQFNSYTQIPYGDIGDTIESSDITKIKAECANQNNDINEYIINIFLTKIYDNKLF